jgi:hypothetical protein
VRSILENPRYTGYAIFGRWTKHERLIDPDDVGAGHIVRFRRANPDQIVRSREPAHPAIVTVQDFVDVQLLRRFRGASGPQRLNADRGRPSSPTSSAAGSDAASACDVWKDPRARHAPTIAVQREASFRALLP